ncbi:MAG: retroviral-like aspartic protease family protein [Treponema sp.]|jgi:clan AA aspartic protease|nr:retroviral-like aspartic protease family protein [Treponema sp.]
MGLVHAEITLKNAKDMVIAEKGLVPDYKIRQTTVNALVDSGAWTMVINEATREILGLDTEERSRGTLADGTRAEYKLSSQLEISWKDRRLICQAVIVPNANENLLGAIPLEAMDLMINPVSQELVGVHGDEALYSLK